MKHEVERKRDENSVLIRLGTLFAVQSNGQTDEKRIHVVVGIGRENYFYSACVREDEVGVYLRIESFGGTVHQDFIGKVIGQMTPEEVLKATQLGCRKLGFELPESVAHNLLAQKGSRRLILDR